MHKPFKLCLLLLLSTIILSGCASQSWFGSATADFPWKKPDTTPDNPCQIDKCNQKEAIAAFVAASRFCRDVGNFYESRSNRSNGAELAVGWVGAIAGAVISPLAQGSAKTAWSGLSGATNGLQTQLSDTFSAALYIRRQAAVAQAADDAAEKILSKDNSNDPDKQVYLAIDMVRRCAVAASKVDASVMQAITTVDKSDNQSNSSVQDKSGSQVKGSTQEKSSAQKKPAAEK